MPQSPRARLDKAFDRARQARRAALIGYLPAGYPTWDRSIAAARVLAQHCDILEIGLPQAATWDGPDIRAACAIARRSCSSPASVLRLIEELTASVRVPVTVMSYWQPIGDTGDVEGFAVRVADSGAVGAVLPDIHPHGQAAARWLAAAAEHDLATSFLAVPGQMAPAATASTGWIYQAAQSGPTGTRAVLDLPSIRSRTSSLNRFGAAAPICIGIGVSSPYQAAAISPHADGVAVGTRFVRALGQGGLPGLSRVARSYALAVSAVQGAHDSGRAAA